MSRVVAEHWRKTNPAKRVVLLTRSASAGQQRYGAATWSGDVQSTWDALAKQIPAALNFAMSGQPYWNSDIGGFFAGRYTGPSDPAFQELYIRWMQFACFSPVMRSHGTNHPREIYQFGTRGDAAFDILEKYIRLRYTLLPYLYATAWDASRHGGSFMRPMVMDYPGVESLAQLTDQYLFGRSLLVAPVVSAGAAERGVVLPPGVWYDFWTNERLEGGITIQRATPLDLIPLYVKAGTILPLGPDVQYATEKPWDHLMLRVYPGADGSFTLYEDECDGYRYEQGAFTTIAMEWSDAAGTLQIGERKGSFDGVLKRRTFEVSLTGGEQTSISYDGSAMEVRLK
jgi:alpha-D-xyloside xylohydrolase